MIFVTLRDGSLVNREGSSLLIFVTPMSVSLVIMEISSLLIFVTPINVRLVIIEGSLLSRFLLLHWMEALSLWKVFCCRDFCYFNGR